jgi:hypothetical protein
MMKHKKLVRWSALGALAVGTAFQNGSCSINPDCPFAQALGLAALAEQSKQIAESTLPPNFLGDVTRFAEAK